MKAVLAAACILAIGAAATAIAHAATAALQVSVRVLSVASIETSEADPLGDVSAITIGTPGLRAFPPMLIRMSLKTGPAGNMSLGVLSAAATETTISSQAPTVLNALLVQCEQKILNGLYVPAASGASSVSNCVDWGPHTSMAAQVRLTVFYFSNGILPMGYAPGAEAVSVVVSQT